MLHNLGVNVSGENIIGLKFSELERPYRSSSIGFGNHQNYLVVKEPTNIWNLYPESAKNSRT